MNTTLRTAASAACLLLAAPVCLLLAGCHVTESGSGDQKNVAIGTPFGSLKVNSNDKGDLSAIGLSAYPGAVPTKDNDDQADRNNADVNLSFGSFHLGVKAATFQTTDSPDKVIAFYRKDLHTRYGDVIECQNDKPVGTPTHTAQGATCGDHGSVHVDTEDKKPSTGVHISRSKDSDGKVELRAGSELHQHIVGVDPKDGGTKIGLVALDLPSHLADHDSKDSE